MNKIIYDKLVRDKIPEIITADGKSAVTEVLSDIEYITRLDAKLAEEFAEYQESKDIEELADMLEVIYGIAKIKGVCATGLEDMRREKADKRGGFEKKILLKEVIEK